LSKAISQVAWFAVADNGAGIPETILADVLTVGFSTRYGSRDSIGRFGVGFKLASISQARRPPERSQVGGQAGRQEKREKS
jgi:hypothetical protein